MCTAATPEREPDGETAPQPLAANTVARGELRASEADVDCYQVNLPRAATLRAEARRPGPALCFDPVRVRLTDATGALVAERAGSGLNGRGARRWRGPSTPGSTPSACGPSAGTPRTCSR